MTAPNALRLPVALLLVCFSRQALGEPLPLTAIPGGDDKIVGLKQGQPAPFDAQAFDTPTALRWANYLYQCKFRLDADVAYQKKLDDADKGALATELLLEQKQYDAVTKDLQKRLGEAQSQLEHPPFYKEVWFGVAIGVIASMGLMAATAAVVGATK